MKRVLFNILSVSFLIITLFCCTENPTINPGINGADVPEFENGSTEQVEKTANSVKISAKITKENGSKITLRGFYFGTNPNPSLENGENADDTGVGIGKYEISITGLINDTTYYFIPFAENSIGIGTGNQLSIRTNRGIGDINKVTLNDEHASTFKAEIDIKSKGEGNPDNVKVGLYLFTDLSAAAIDTITNAISTNGNIYNYHLTGLKPSTKYYVKPFISNDFGIFIGIDYSITTKDGLFSVGKTKVVSDYTEASFEAEVDNGNDPTVTIIERGFCWAKTANPTIADSVLKCGSSVGKFAGTIYNIAAQQEYYVCAYAINNFGMTTYGDIESFTTKTDVPTVRTEPVDVTKMISGNVEIKGVILNGGRTAVNYSGLCWSTSNNDPNGGTYSHINVVAGVGETMTVNLSNLRGGTRYYYCAFAKNDDGITYGEVLPFTTPPIIATGLKPFPGDRRFANSAAYFAIDDKFYLLGGDLGSRYTDELYAYSIPDNDWVQLRSFIGGPARWQAAVSYGNGAYVYGGYDGSGDEKAGLYYYKANMADNEWDNSSYAFVPDTITVCKAIGCTYKNSVFFIGGISGDTVRNDVWSLIAQSSWDKKTDFPEAQSGGVAVVINDEVYAGLGKNSAGVCTGNLWKTSNEGASWNLVTNCPINQGSILAGVECNNRLYLVDEGYYILEYNPETSLWTRKAQLPASHWEIHCMYTHKATNKIYIGLGTNSAKSLVVYDPSWDN
jgi:hypothetical protein